MIIEEIKKIKLSVYIISFILAAAVGLCFINSYSKKDLISVMVATFILVIEIYLIFKDKKTSVLLFIISIPVLVTARKLCYYNIFIFRITYETIYISILFMANIKSIFEVIRNSYVSADKSLRNLFTLIIILLIFAYNSCFFSNNVFYSLGEVYIGLVAPVMLMLSAIAIFKKDDIKSLYFSLFAAMDLSCLYGFMQIIGLRIPLSEVVKNREYITFGFHNINIFATIIVAVIPLVLYTIIYKTNSNKEKIFLILTFILNNISLFLTYSRGAWICVIISMAIVLFNKKHKKTIVAFGVLVLLFIKPALNYILSRGTNVSIWQNTSIIARMQGIFTDLAIMIRFPFGAGPGTYPSLYKKYAVTGYRMIPESIRYKISVAPYALENAHNLFLEVGVEFGIVCLIVLIILIIYMLLVAVRNYRENVGLFSAIISYSVISMLTGSQFNHKGVITGTLILFLYFGIIQLNNKSAQA
jgi:O-antigen ligase